MHTPRKKEGKTKLFLLEKMFAKPDFKWQTKDFLAITKKELGIQQRQTIIRHLKGLKDLGLIKFTPSSNFYYLPENCKTFEYLKTLDDTFEKVVEGVYGLLIYYPEEVVRNYLSYIENEALGKIAKMPVRKQLKVISKREVDMTTRLLHTLAITEHFLNTLDSLNLDSKKKKKIRKSLEDFRKLIKNTLITESLENIKKVKSERRLPRFIKPILTNTIQKIRTKTDS